MAVTFLIPTYLATFTGNRSSISVDGQPATVRDALEALWTKHPALRDRIVDERGEVRPHVNLFVGAECIRFTEGLATKVPEGSEISVVPAVSGGC